jgi:hypothetical protein
MKSAVIAAIVAALISSSATLAATSHFSGKLIKIHSLPLNRIHGKLPVTKTVTVNNVPAPRVLAASVNSTLDQEQTTEDITNNSQTVTAQCPAGEVAIAGGYTTSIPVNSPINADGPTDDGTGWKVTINNAIGIGVSLTTTVSCEPSA